MTKGKVLIFLMLLSSFFMMVSVVSVSAAETVDLLPDNFNKNEFITSEYLYLDSIPMKLMDSDYNPYDLDDTIALPNSNGEYSYTFDMTDTLLSEEWETFSKNVLGTQGSHDFYINFIWEVTDDPDVTVDDFLWVSNTDGYSWDSNIYGDNGIYHFMLQLRIDVGPMYLDKASVDMLYSGDGTIAFETCQMSLNYTVTGLRDNSTITNVIDADYTRLPDSTEIVVDALSWKQTDEVNNIYDLWLAVPAEEYFSVSYFRVPVQLDSDLEFNEFLNRQVKYTTSNEGDRILIFDMEGPGNRADYNGLNNIQNPVRLYRSTFTINLTKGETYRYDDFAINGIITKESNSKAYLNLYLPMEVDELISCTIEYNYRINELFQANDPIQHAVRYLDSESVSEIHPPAWLYWLLGSYLYNIINDQMIDQQDIVKLENHTDSINEDAINILGLESSVVDSSQKYKLFLGQFSTTTSIGYDISEVALVSMIYQSGGIYYDVQEEILEENITIVEETNDSIIERAEEFIDDIFGNDTTDDEPGFFDQVQETSKLVFTGIVVCLSLIIVIRLIGHRHRKG
ncbi:hypothetical protein ACAG96_04510 [Candidatus Izemoplasma sp. B36]|uniref:hypothetical protein n=1 Tax=Candidatus Izemoplasma sp. B36 TaxID=3242468 RepID=UPI003555EF2B